MTVGSGHVCNTWRENEGGRKSYRKRRQKETEIKQKKEKPIHELAHNQKLQND